MVLGFESPRSYNLPWESAVTSVLTPGQMEHCKRFVGRVASLVYPGDAYRVTLFAAVSDTSIGPRFRYNEANNATDELVPSEATVWFERGWPVAGLAWEKAGAPIILVLPEHVDVLFFTNGLRLPRKLAERLVQSPSMRRARQILCLGIPAPTPLVLSVDTFTTDGLGSGGDDDFKLHKSSELYNLFKEFCGVTCGEWTQHR
jgi:hypothetical protein